MKTRIKTFPGLLGALVLALLLAGVTSSLAWWDEAWSGRTKFILNPGAEGAAVEAGEPGEAVVLVRLHTGILPFDSLQPDGSDLRFVAEDDKTPLSFHLEKFDPLLGEALAWVRLPSVGGGKPTEFWLYYGNAEPGPEGAADKAKTYPDSARIVYHLGEQGTPPQDATANAVNAETAGNASQGTIIADGLRLVGREPIKIPAVAANEWLSGASASLVMWIKPISTANAAVLFSRPESNGLTVGLEAGGAPYIEVSGLPKAVAADKLADGVWRQLTVVGGDGKITLYVDGVAAASLAGGLPAGRGAMFLGGPDPATGETGRFLGEIDEFQLHAAALPAGLVRLLYLTQAGSELSAKVLAPGEAEQGHGGGGGHGGMLEHLMLFGDIANNMMFDGWIAIAVCVVMMIAGWSVAFAKFVDLGRIEKGNKLFLDLWSDVSSDLTALDLDSPDAARSLGKDMNSRALTLLTSSPLYHVYHVGSDQIRHRLARDKSRGQGLRARSIQAIRAALDAATVREQHRLNKGIVYLTVSIAGGPYVGLLGTVVGVMITFAVIAKSGEVDVNSIAPGIASALLATTVGLLVAIPALFMYSFLNTRIKGVIAMMQVFIDEFVAKVAEFYAPPGEEGTVAPIQPVRTPEEAARREETGGRESAEILADAAPQTT